MPKQAKIRFDKYLNEVRNAKTDLDRVMAAFRLMESYRGFRYAHIAKATEKFLIERYALVEESQDGKKRGHI